MDDVAPSEGQSDEQRAFLESKSVAGRWHGLRTWQIIVAVVALMALAAVVGIALGRRTGTNEQVSSATSAGPTATASVGGSVGLETGSTTPMPMADRNLDRFLARAAEADEALTEAAARVNASATATDITYDQQTVDLLASASPEVLAPLLPPGMADALQRAALLVYSNLVSRWAAMSASPCPHEVGTHPRSDYDDNNCFTQGGGAASRFDADLATLTALARSMPEFAIPGPSSRDAEELAARIHSIDAQNRGCGSTGGFIATDPIPVVWQVQPAADGQEPWQGTVGGIAFRGTYDETRGWAIVINAC